MPSGTGTMISPAHFGQRTTVPALRDAIPSTDCSTHSEIE